MTRKRLSLPEIFGRYQGVAQDIDSIKYALRHLNWRLDAIIAFFKIDVKPDMLGETLNPSDAFLNQIIAEARFVGKDQKMPRRKSKRWAKK